MTHRDALADHDYDSLVAVLTTISDGVAVHECSPGVIADAILAAGWRAPERPTLPDLTERRPWHPPTSVGRQCT